MSWRVFCRGVAQVPGDISTIDQARAAVVSRVEDTRVTSVSGVAAAVATSRASAGGDPAKLTVHPVVVTLADRVQPEDSEGNRRIDIRSSARAAAVDTKMVVPEDTKEDMDTADAMKEGRNHTASNTKSSIRRAATITLSARAATVMSFKESTEFCCRTRGRKLFGTWLTM